MELFSEEQLIPVDDGNTLDFGDVQIKVWYPIGHAVSHTMDMQIENKNLVKRHFCN